MVLRRRASRARAPLIDSAVLHWTTRLMVFPRNVGFGRCYLVSTRHEILSNIDRNAKPNLNSAAAPKKPTWNKPRESTDPIPVLLLSLESQTVVFQPFDFHLRKFKKFIIEKFYFHKKAATFNLTLAQVERIIGLARIRTDFHRFTEIGRIFDNQYIFNNKKVFQVEIWKMVDSPCLIWKLDEIIRRVRRMELTNIEKPRKGDFRAGVKIHKNRGEARVSAVLACIIFPDNFKCILHL